MNDDGEIRIVECRVDSRVSWLGMVHRTATHAAVEDFDGSELLLRLVHRHELGRYANAAAIEDAR